MLTQNPCSASGDCRTRGLDDDLAAYDRASPAELSGFNRYDSAFEKLTISVPDNPDWHYPLTRASAEITMTVSFRAGATGLSQTFIG